MAPAPRWSAVRAGVVAGAPACCAAAAAARPARPLPPWPHAVNDVPSATTNSTRPFSMYGICESLLTRIGINSTGAAVLLPTTLRLSLKVRGTKCGAAYPGCGPAFLRVLPAESLLQARIACPTKPPHNGDRH